MVKGISRQVIVVYPKEPALFEQAIFILNDGAMGKEGITDAQLLREAGRLMSVQENKKKGYLREGVWACAGAVMTAVLFLILGSL